MKKYLILFSLFFCFIINAQTNLDTLYSIWQDKTQTDSTRVKAYNDYIWNGFLFEKPDSAFILAKELLIFAQNKQLPLAKAYAYKLQGVSLKNRADYQQALDYYGRSLKIFEEIGSRKAIGGMLHNIGNTYLNLGNNLEALDYYKRSIKISEEIENKAAIAPTLMGIGNIYYKQGNYPQAMDYYKRSLKKFEEIENKKGITASLNSIGIVYETQGNYQQALDYYHRCLAINEEIGNKLGISTAVANIGIVYEFLENYPKALDYYQRSIKIDEEIGDKLGVAITLNNIGVIYLKKSMYNKALVECRKSHNLSIDIGAIDLQEDACKCLYDAYKALGNGNKALEYHEQMLVLNDSLKSEETAKKLQQMEFSKQVLADSLLQVEKDLQVEMIHQAEVRKKDKNRNLALGAGIFFLVLSGGFYSRWRYVKKSKTIIEKEKDRSESLLLNILPSEIAEELKEKGSADARDFDLVSILFTDFKGFTQASEKLTAKQLIDEINHCFKAFDLICEKYGIEKIKTIGDAYMAAGGLPVPSDTAVKNTALAALEMQAFISERIISKEANGEKPFKMRLGIHSGPVVAGIVGVKKFQYDIWGDTVNTASRMESSGEIGKVNISEDTYKLLKDDPEFKFDPRGKVQAKGKGEMRMFFVSKTA